MKAWLLLTTAVVVRAWPLDAQPATLGQPILTQSVTVSTRPTTEPGVLDLIETRPGDRLDLQHVRETIAHLMGLGRYEDVVVHADPVEGGVALRYELVPVRLVDRLDFRGEVGVSERILRDQVAERVGDAPEFSRIPDIVGVLETVYRDNGYLHPSITPRPDLAVGAGLVDLPVEVSAGPRVRYAAIEVNGNAPVPLTSLPSSLGLSVGQFYRKPEVERRLGELVEEWQRDGYYEAEANHVLSPAPDGRSAELAIDVDAGPHVTILFEGDELSARERRDLVPIQREGSLDQDLLEDSENRIEQYLHAQGYRDAAASYQRVPRDGELAIVFTVERGPRYRAASVSFQGLSGQSEVELAGLLRSAVGEPVVDAGLDADASRIAEHYQRRGFTQVVVVPVVEARPGASDPVSADVRFDVTEGPQTMVGTITIDGVGESLEQELRALLGTRAGAPYYRPQVAVDRDAVVLRLLNDGYPDAAVEPVVTFIPDRSLADVRLTVVPGPQVFVDHVLIVGNERTDSATIRREMALQPGMPLGYADLTESQRRLSAMGLFRRVRITQLDHGAVDRRDLLVSVEEAPATTVGYGGGLEGGTRLRRTEPDGPAVEVFELAPRGFLELGRRNLFGRNQSINLFGRASLRSRASATNPEPGEPAPSGYTLRDYRAIGTFRAPRVLGTRNDLLITGFLEQGIRSSFNFTRRGTRVELTRRLTPTVSFSGRYVIERTKLFEERFDPEDEPLIDRLFPQVRLSTASASLIRDTRDDALAPQRGALIGADGTVALRAIGSEVGFVKSFVQGFIYRLLPGDGGIVFAGGARLGLANGFPRGVEVRDDEGNVIIGPDGQPETETVDDLPASERFFAGGDTSVRGFALDRLGTPETIDRNGFPTGGNAVLVLNAELRIPVWRDLGAVGFVDAGNVFNRIDDFSFAEIRPTSGFGIRYRSPIGPLRVDLGFKLDREFLPDGSQEPRTELHISLGQAF